MGIVYFLIAVLIISVWLPTRYRLRLPVWWPFLYCGFFFSFSLGCLLGGMPPWWIHAFFGCVQGGACLVMGLCVYERGRWIKKISLGFGSFIVREWETYVLTHRVCAYYRLHADKKLYPSDVAEALELDAAHVRDVCNDLISKGLIKSE